MSEGFSGWLTAKFWKTITAAMKLKNFNLNIKLEIICLYGVSSSSKMKQECDIDSLL
jgi:hypothetical protein